MTNGIFAEHTYARQSTHQRAHGGGVGRGEFSWWKHEAIERAMRRQLPVLAKMGRGLIIDMHAGDGEPTPHPQPDFWAGGALITTPHLAISMADAFGADVWLCEKSHAARHALDDRYGGRARILRNHERLLDELSAIGRCAWTIVLNDPNGHGQHGVEVMQRIAKANQHSDFVVVVNHQSIRRHIGVGKSDNTGNAFALAVEASKEKYAWMVDPDEWAARLGKRHVLATTIMAFSDAMKPQILLISNFIPGYAR